MPSEWDTSANPYVFFEITRFYTYISILLLAVLLFDDTSVLI